VVPVSWAIVHGTLPLAGSVVPVKVRICLEITFP
jgi:hypothetical protein